MSSTSFWRALSVVMIFSFIWAPLSLRAEEVVEATAETISEIAFVGQMIELSTTEAPTTIVVREFDEDGDGWTDYTVEITSSTTFGSGNPDLMSMTNWITGDYVVVRGQLNENTGVVTATAVENQSINPYQHRGLNGWVTAIDPTASTMTVQWNGAENTIHITGNTKMVVPPINPAALTDFQLNDRVRLRLIQGSPLGNEARIIIALRRAENIFLKGRTRQFSAELVGLSGTSAPAELEVVLQANAHLRSGDVNNLIGVEGEHKVVLVDAYTKLVRRHQGDVTLSAFLPGDTLFIVGRANDDGTITAKLIRDDEVDHSTITGTHGRITSVESASQSFVLHGGPHGSDRTVTTTSETVFERNGAVASFASLTLGDKVRVRGTFDETTATFAATEVFAWSEEYEDAEALVFDEELDEIEQDEIERLLASVCDADEDSVDDESESIDEDDVELEDEAEEEHETEGEDDDLSAATEDGEEEDEDEDEIEDEDEMEDEAEDAFEDEFDESELFGDVSEEEFAELESLLNELFNTIPTDETEADPLTDESLASLCDTLDELEDEREDVDDDEDVADEQEDALEDALEDELEWVCYLAESDLLTPTDEVASACEEQEREDEFEGLSLSDDLEEANAELEALADRVDVLAAAGVTVSDEVYNLVFSAAFSIGFAEGMSESGYVDEAQDALNDAEEALDLLEDLVEDLEDDSKDES